MADEETEDPFTYWYGLNPITSKWEVYRNPGARIVAAYPLIEDAVTTCDKLNEGSLSELDLVRKR